MKKDVQVLGNIDCPCCGTAGGMRVTADKNGDPFGYCIAKCGQQLRVGGNAYRVAEFRRRFPWANPVTVTDTDPEPIPASTPVQDPHREAPAPAPKPTPAPTPAPAKPKEKASWFAPVLSKGKTTA